MCSNKGLKAKAFKQRVEVRCRGRHDLITLTFFNNENYVLLQTSLMLEPSHSLELERYTNVSPKL